MQHPVLLETMRRYENLDPRVPLILSNFDLLGPCSDQILHLDTLPEAREPTLSLMSWLKSMVGLRPLLTEGLYRNLPGTLLRLLPSPRLNFTPPPAILVCSDVIAAVASYGGSTIRLTLGRSSSQTAIYLDVNLHDRLAPMGSVMILSMAFSGMRTLAVGLCDCVVILRITIKRRAHKLSATVVHVVSLKSNILENDVDSNHRRSHAPVYPVVAQTQKVSTGRAPMRLFYRQYLPSFMTASSCGRYLAVGSHLSSRIVLVSLTKLSPITSFVISGQCTAIAMSQRGFCLAVGTSMGELLIYDFLTNRSCTVQNLPSPPNAISFAKHIRSSNAACITAMQIARGGDNVMLGGEDLINELYNSRLDLEDNTLNTSTAKHTILESSNGSAGSTFLENEQTFEYSPTLCFGLSETLVFSCARSPLMYFYSAGSFDGAAMTPTIRLQHMGTFSAAPYEVSDGRAAGGCITGLDWHNDQLVVACANAKDLSGTIDCSLLVLSTKVEYTGAGLKTFLTGVVLPPLGEQICDGVDSACATALGGSCLVAFGRTVYQIIV